ncbi:M56 family metallopeptidase [Actinacidiphila paucisporea]|uniref:Peptidase family M48 n=1 Tax=Actinacidiphila paucisporea TaxID=310782 RepID=A0A1M7LSN2_9ACTN|nr:M56 family metallopeptidase [Actinacidiphila paucisporea]SHM81275.1 Peptidase family M48 [Actinacidiphila paucisporea]
MGLTLCVPALVVTILVLAAPAAARGMPPRTASWVLATVAVLGAGTWLTVLAMLGVTRVGEIPEIAELGRWSPHVLAAHSPVHGPVAGLCALAAATGLLVTVFAVWRRVAVLAGARRECRGLPSTGDLVVLDDPVPTAYALPGSPGRVVVSAGMLRALRPGERRALLAHERAHLAHRHHLFLLTFHALAAANPLLRPLARAGAFALERWADEDAVTAVRDRSLVARAIARAALAGTSPPSWAPAATGGPVPQRVSALLAPPVPARRAPVAACTALMVVCCVSLALAAHHVDAAFDAAAFHRVGAHSS